MAVQVDPIEHIYINYGTVEVRGDAPGYNRRVQLLFAPFPWFDRMPLQISVIGDNFRDATEKLIREIQVALTQDPPDVI